MREVNRVDHLQICAGSTRACRDTGHGQRRQAEIEKPACRIYMDRIGVKSRRKCEAN